MKKVFICATFVNRYVIQIGGYLYDWRIEIISSEVETL